MEVALVFIGILLITAGIKGTEHDLAAQLESDVLGSDGFIVWLAALITIWLIGKIPGFQTPAKYLIVLIMVSIVLRNSNISQNLIAAISGAISSGPIPGQPIQTGSGSTSGGAGGSTGGGINTSDISTIATVAALA